MAEGSFKYLDFDVLAHIDDMKLLAKTVVEGFLLGLHRSPFCGFSVEFAEYRQYVPGDEIRYVDWKLYGKTDRLYVKQFEEETNLRCYILLDCSASMGYGSGKLNKLQYGSYLAAALAYLMMSQRDAAGLVLFDSKIREYYPPRSRQTHLHLMLSALEKVKAEGRTEMSCPLHELAQGLNMRGLVVLISDLFDEPEHVLDGLQHFHFLGNDLIVFHLFDPSELSLPFNDLTEFIDPESGERVITAPQAVRQRYQAEVAAFQQKCEKGCADLKADYQLINTATPLELALSQYLFHRSRRS